MDSRTMHPGKYLKAADFPTAQLWTISGLQEEEMSDQKTGGTKKEWVLYFSDNDQERGLVLNITNTGVLQECFGFETDEWMDQQIVIYKDRVQFGPKIVDAIRLRAPKRTPAKMKTAVPVKQKTENPAEDMDDDIPF